MLRITSLSLSLSAAQLGQASLLQGDKKWIFTFSKISLSRSLFFDDDLDFGRIIEHQNTIRVSFDAAAHIDRARGGKEPMKNMCEEQFWWALENVQICFSYFLFWQTWTQFFSLSLSLVYPIFLLHRKSIELSRLEFASLSFSVCKWMFSSTTTDPCV